MTPFEQCLVVGAALTFVFAYLVLIVDFSKLVQKNRSLRLQVLTLKDLVASQKSAIKVAVDVKNRQLVDHKLTLNSIATQNDNDPNFKFWAKKLAQDSLDRAK